MSAWTIVATPVDDLLVQTDGSAVTGIEFAAAPAGRWGSGTTATRCWSPPGAQLEEYFARDRHDFDLPLRPAGTPFQQRVWEALRTIPSAAP